MASMKVELLLRYRGALAAISAVLLESAGAISRGEFEISMDWRGTKRPLQNSSPLRTKSKDVQVVSNSTGGRREDIRTLSFPGNV